MKKRISLDNRNKTTIKIKKYNYKKLLKIRNKIEKEKMFEFRVSMNDALDYIFKKLEDKTAQSKVYEG